MHDREEQRVLNKENSGVELEALDKQRSADAEPGQLRAQKRDEFALVSGEMLRILEDKQPVLEFDESLDPTIKFALTALFEARTATDSETGDFISAAARQSKLNQALMHLQPILSNALRPDLHAVRNVYDRLVVDVKEVRSDIKSAALVQMPVKAVPETAKIPKRDDDDDDDGDGDKEKTGEERGLRERDGDGGDNESDESGGLLKRAWSRLRKRPTSTSEDQENSDSDG